MIYDSQVENNHHKISQTIPGFTSFQNKLILENDDFIFEKLDVENQIKQLKFFGNKFSDYYYQTEDEYSSKLPSRKSNKNLKILEFLKILQHKNNSIIKEYDNDYKKDDDENENIWKNKNNEQIYFIQKVFEQKLYFSDTCKNLLKKIISIIIEKSKSELNYHQNDMQFSQKTNILELFNEYFYCQISDFWFKQESFIADRVFKVTSEVLSFLKLTDLIQIDNPQKIESHLQISINLLKELDYTFDLEKSFRILFKVLDNISYLVHYVNDTEVLPGNETIMHIFIWTVLRSQNSKLKSTLKYLELFIEEKQKIGELGFAMTQLEASIIFIGKKIINRKS